MIVEKHLQKLPEYYNNVIVDKYVVMPNHMHMILILNGENCPSVPQIIGQFKTGVTKEIRRIYPDTDVWQRSFHDHIIRNQKSYEKIWLYIEGNPQNWEKDCFFMDREG
jgi:REP element-mobilizing transposase RayT